MNNAQDVITAACRKLEDTVQDMGVELKFELSSIASLEEVILAIKQFGDKSALSGACFMVGAYLGEIIRQACGGQWGSSGEGGTPSILLGDTVIYPIEKVKEFVKTPRHESLIFYASALVGQQRA